MKRSSVIILSLCAILSCFTHITANACDTSVTNHTYDNHYIVNEESYVDNDIIHEKVTYYDYDEIKTTERISYPDNKFIIIDSESNNILAEGTIQYDVLTKDIFAKPVEPFGSEITNPNFYHIFVATTPTQTYFASDIKNGVLPQRLQEY